MLVEKDPTLLKFGLNDLNGNAWKERCRKREEVSLLICEEKRGITGYVYLFVLARNVIHVDVLYVHGRKILKPWHVQALMKTWCRG